MSIISMEWMSSVLSYACPHGVRCITGHDPWRYCDKCYIDHLKDEKKKLLDRITELEDEIVTLTPPLNDRGE